MMNNWSASSLARIPESSSYRQAQPRSLTSFVILALCIPLLAHASEDRTNLVTAILADDATQQLDIIRKLADATNPIVAQVLTV